MNSTGGYPMLKNDYNTISRSVKTPVKAQGKIIGYLEEGAFIKVVTGSKHRLRYPPAWAIDAEAFDTEVKPNATEIVVIDRETGIKYHTPVQTFDRLKGELNRGFGRQYFLLLNHWQVEENGNRQLSLWGGNVNG
jgi:hypothetical protein